MHILPNVDEWLPGDILLSRPKRPDPKATAIRLYQRRTGAPAESASWMHVSIYDGAGQFWDAMPRRGVQPTAVMKTLLPMQEYSLRRLVGGSVDEQVLIQELSYTRDYVYPRYDLFMADLLLRRLVGKRELPRHFDQNSMICSRFVEIMLAHASGRKFFDHVVSLPCDFHHDVAFSTVEVGWRRLPPAR